MRSCRLCRSNLQDAPIPCTICLVRRPRQTNSLLFIVCCSVIFCRCSCVPRRVTNPCTTLPTLKNIKCLSDFPFSLVHGNFVPGNVEVQLRQRSSEMKLVRITAMSVIAFILSWAPYCFVSLVAVFTRKHVIALWEAEIPELLAKASVVYNPVIYTIMNSRFRATLLRILHVRRRTRTISSR